MRQATIEYLFNQFRGRGNNGVNSTTHPCSGLMPLVTLEQINMRNGRTRRPYAHNYTEAWFGRKISPDATIWASASSRPATTTCSIAA